MEVSAEMEALIDEATSAMIQMYPEMLANIRATPIEIAIKNAVDKYSPGIGFEGHYKKRRQAFDAGWKGALIRTAMKWLRTGKYTPEFYHAFPKAQVVDATKLFTYVTGGQPKNVRTVVAEDFLHNLVAYVVCLDEKRDHWLTTFTGSHMPLNQNMAHVFRSVAGYEWLGEGDGAQFDSTMEAVAKRILIHLNNKGMRNANMASVMNNHHASMIGKAYIANITLPKGMRVMHGAPLVKLPDGTISRSIDIPEDVETG